MLTTFLLFLMTNKSERFLSALDSQHQNLKFTIEIATQSLCFLDVEVKILKSGVEILVWRKPSHTKLLSSFIAICPKTWKTVLIIKTADSDTVSTYQVSSVQLVTDRKLEAFNKA